MTDQVPTMSHVGNQPAWPSPDEWNAVVNLYFPNPEEKSMNCKHCRVAITHDQYGNWSHAEGVQQGKGRCGINPYGFLAEPVGAPCSDHPANPCNGALGLTPAAPIGQVPTEEPR